MITAIDTNILLDVFIPDEIHGLHSRALLRHAYDAGEILVCDVVYAELVPAFSDRIALDVALRNINAAYSPIDIATAYDAGARWAKYREAGGTRERIIADFLIGAHAATAADVFLTRDQGFYATYFPELRRS